ncbi:hypothetical protein GCM10009855_14610 [Gordonia cholesterolivorans]|uniref:Uncharacterized protein n=1 Tax=Gordonia cholesterolivorans TaxID=559625 RepID=A0ABN3HCW8_9ACTN
MRELRVEVERLRRERTWPKTTPTGITYTAPETYAELCLQHDDAAQASVEGWEDSECPPEPTWEMVGLAHREVEKLRERKSNVARTGGYLAGVAMRERDEAIAERDELRVEVERLRGDLEGAAYRAGLQQGKLARAEAAIERARELAERWDADPCVCGYRIPDGNDTDSQCLHCGATSLLRALDGESARG